MRQTFIICAAALALSPLGCKKGDKGDKAAESDKAPAAAPSPRAAEPAGDPPAAKPDPLAHIPTDPAANFAVATISHADPKPSDPVHVVFKQIEIKRVAFKDPKDLTGASAEIRIALGELDSGVPDRDRDLESPAYFDAAKNPTAVISVTDVVKAGDSKYNANAKVEAMGITKEWPVSFEVTGSGDGWVRIEGAHKFRRSDFKIGEGQLGPADDLEIELHLTLKNT